VLAFRILGHFSVALAVDLLFWPYVSLFEGDVVEPCMSMFASLVSYD